MNQVKNIDEEKLLAATIWSYFSKVQDPRVQDNQKYEFKDLIVAIVCGIICGANNVESIVNYIESKIDWFGNKLGLQQPPSYKTVWWLLVLIDPEELYPNNFKSWFWATRKLSEFVDLKWPNIRNMRSLKVGKLRRFGAAENPTFEVVWV